jgi:hypothetical protein
VRSGGAKSRRSEAKHVDDLPELVDRPVQVRPPARDRHVGLVDEPPVTRCVAARRVRLRARPGREDLAADTAGELRRGTARGLRPPGMDRPSRPHMTIEPAPRRGPAPRTLETRRDETGQDPANQLGPLPCQNGTRCRTGQVYHFRACPGRARRRRLSNIGQSSHGP